MTKEAFFRNVRRAYGFMQPLVEADSVTMDAGRVASQLRRATLWLSPSAVADFCADDFAETPELQSALIEAVDSFMTIAHAVGPDVPATDQQADVAEERFERIANIVRATVLADWQSALRRLLDDAVEWADQQTWPTKEQTKDLTELLLGRYEVPQLLIHANSVLLVLDPVGRFVPGAMGIVDLSVAPSYHSVMIPREEKGWTIRIDKVEGSREKRLAWDREGFLKAVRHLQRLA